MDFEIDIEYSNRASFCTSEAAASQFLNPCDEPWDIEWFQWEYTDRVDEDIHGYPIINANLDPPDPNLQEEFGSMGLRITRAQELWDDGLMSQYARKVINSDYFWGHSPGECLINRVGARRMRMGDLFFWQATFEILFNPFSETESGHTIGGWKRRVRHEGYNVRVKINPIFQKIVRARCNPANDADETGDCTAEPVLLDAEGCRLAPDGISSDAFWLEFDTKKSLPFSALALE
jgi:hypothetical protein